MVAIAPLSYERYAVLVSPLLVPDVLRADAPPPVKRVEELSPVAASSRYADTRVNTAVASPAQPMENLKESVRTDRQRQVRHEPPPLPPPDTKNFLAPASRSAGTVQSETAPIPSDVIRRYERPELMQGDQVNLSV